MRGSIKMKERKWRIKTTVLALSVSIVLSGCALGSAGEEPSSEADKKEETRIAHVKTKEFKASHPAAIPAKSKARTDTFVAGISAPGGVFLPYFYENGWDGNATDPIFEPLVKLDKTGKPAPALAESWKISKDQLTYTFRLRKISFSATVHR